jgi:type II secretory ATPase GspE/PulE/Tfp pilus assembly ATPase PilB-like protein
MPQTPEAPAVTVVERLLRAAVEAGASDLHIDPSEHGVNVRMRRDGVLEQLEILPDQIREHLVGRVKALADLLVYRTDVPQEGRIAAERSGLPTDIRVATYPTVFGERIAVRFDAREAGPRTIDDIGFEEIVANSLRGALDQPDGVVLVTGPSGSGKTTTLYASLRHIVNGTRARSIMTVEDPIERRVQGVTQTQTDSVAGLDFARALRSLLRQDPEVLLVGEIRDRETAKIALEAGLTGHLVLSTVHAGTAPLVFARLLEMGVEPFVLTTAVRGVLAQRLVRRRCDQDDCAERGANCPKCRGSGYHGRVPIGEWVPMTAGLRKVVLSRGDGSDLTVAASEAGGRSLRESAEALIANGMTTHEEVNRVLGSR